MNSISSLPDYIALINDINQKFTNWEDTAHLWYRGQGEHWSLKPSIYRKIVNFNYERELNRDFKYNSIPFLDKQCENEIEYLFLMQHYKTPTRLIDWSESYLVALYFAVANYQNQKDGVVFILNPWSLNNYSTGKMQIFNYDSEYVNENYILSDVDDYVERRIKARYPIAIRTPKTNKRLASQQGVFTIHGSSLKGLENYATHNRDHDGIIIERINIMGTKKYEIFKDLWQSGMKSSSIYPDLEGLSQDLIFQYNYHNRYKWKKSKN